MEWKVKDNDCIKEAREDETEISSCLGDAGVITCYFECVIVLGNIHKITTGMDVMIAICRGLLSIINIVMN